MIVEFSVKNFRSIFELQTISFVATGLSSSVGNSHVDQSNIFSLGAERLLKVIGLYGPNASGKTNIVRALEYFCDAIGALPSPESRLAQLAQPFLYQPHAPGTESYFQIVVIIDEQKYRYGFTVTKNEQETLDNPSQEIITNEWLFGPRNSKHVRYFVRKNLDIQASSSFQIK
ncbi:MAG: AAA family ATPase, partial [Bacteroidota bacterium]